MIIARIMAKSNSIGIKTTICGFEKGVVAERVS